MNEIDAMYQACEEMCQRCPCFVVCRDDDTKLCDAYLERVEELEGEDG